MIRAERAGDEGAIAALITEAFAAAPHSSGTEAKIVDGLREAGALTISLVAEDAGRLIGHVAFSPVTIADEQHGWFGLGPVSVAPDRQARGIGSRLIYAGLDRLRTIGAKGCVLLGDPGYYGRFGFRADARLIYPGPPPEYFLALPLNGKDAAGEVAYHAAFAG